jgi:hypothetical protein
MKSDKNHLTSLFVTMAGIFIIVYLIANWTPDTYRNMGRGWRGERGERREQRYQNNRYNNIGAPNYYVNPWYYTQEDDSCDIESIFTYIQNQKSKDFKSYVDYIKLLCPQNKNMYRIDTYNDVYDRAHKA